MSDRVKLVRFCPDHYEALNTRPDPGHDLFKTPTADYGELLDRVSKHPSYTLFCGDRPIACGGVVILWHGVGEAWAFVANDIAKHALSFVKYTKLKLTEFEILHGLHRIQAAVHSEHKLGHIFMVYLGFHPEGKLLGYGPDKSDYNLYARVTWQKRPS